MTAAQQMEFMPHRPPKGKFKHIPTSAFAKTKWVGEPPTPAFIQSVRVFGVLEPVTVIAVEDGYEVQGGQRRIQAVLANALTLGPEGTSAQEWTKRWATIPAIVYPKGTHPIDIAAVHENEQRSDNVAVTLAAIERLVAKGAQEAQVAALLGLPLQRVRRIMKLSSLHPELRKALADGAVTPSIAEQTAKLGPEAQVALAQKLTQSGKLTQAMVREARTARRDAALQDAFMQSLGAMEAPSGLPAWKVILLTKLREARGVATAYDQIAAATAIQTAIHALTVTPAPEISAAVNEYLQAVAWADGEAES